VHGDGCAESDDEADEENFAREAEAFWTALRVGAATAGPEGEPDDGRL